MTPRHIGLCDRLTRNGFAGAWRTVACALSSWDAFTHVVVHNGPLWRLCCGCRELRSDAPSEGELEAIAYNTKQARRGGARG